MTRCSLGNFLVVSTFATRCAKQAEILAAKDGTIWGQDCPLIFHKWQLSRHLSNCFWITEPLLVRTKYFVCVCSTYILSLPCMRLDHDSCLVMKFVYMRTTCSVAIQNMGLTRIETNEATGIYSFVFIPYMWWIGVRNIWLYKWSNTFNGILSTYRRNRRWSWNNTFDKW